MSGRISRFGNIDPTDGGRTISTASSPTRSGRAANASHARDRSSRFSNGLNLFSNFTYFLDDPEDGDQCEQEDRRIAAGGRVTYRRLGTFLGRHIESAVGVQLRHDAIGNTAPVSDGRSRRLSAPSARTRWRRRSAGVFGQSEIEWSRTLQDHRSDCAATSIGST